MASHSETTAQPASGPEQPRELTEFELLFLEASQLKERADNLAARAQLLRVGSASFFGPEGDTPLENLTSAALFNACFALQCLPDLLARAMTGAPLDAEAPYFGRLLRATNVLKGGSEQASVATGQSMALAISATILGAPQEGFPEQMRAVLAEPLSSVSAASRAAFMLKFFAWNYGDVFETLGREPIERVIAAHIDSSAKQGAVAVTTEVAWLGYQGAIRADGSVGRRHFRFPMSVGAKASKSKLRQELNRLWDRENAEAAKR